MKSHPRLHNYLLNLYDLTAQITAEISTLYDYLYNAYVIQSFCLFYCLSWDFREIILVIWVVPPP